MEKVQIIPPPRDVDPRVLCWKGGAVLGKMDAVTDLWVSRVEWVSYRTLKNINSIPSVHLSIIYRDLSFSFLVFGFFFEGEHTRARARAIFQVLSLCCLFAACCLGYFVFCSDVLYLGRMPLECVRLRSDHFSCDTQCTFRFQQFAVRPDHRIISAFYTFASPYVLPLLFRDVCMYFNISAMTQHKAAYGIRAVTRVFYHPCSARSSGGVKKN